MIENPGSVQIIITVHQKIYGAPGGTRTPDLRVRSPALYPAELQARITIVTLRTK